jgi:hypothetical protein
MAHGWLGWDWGNVPAWAGSVMTGSSLLIAAFTYRRSVTERGREQSDRERAQAARISTWLVNSRLALICNGNDVAVVVQAFFDVPMLFAASDRISFAPGQTRGLRLPFEYERLVQHAGRSELTPTLVIIDSAGQGWMRTGDGDLTRLARAGLAELDSRLSGVPSRLDMESGA